MTGEQGQIANIELVKQVNAAVVYRLIDRQGPISRVRIAEISDLAPASVTKITRQLLEHRLIQEVALEASTGGRRAISLTTVQDRFHFISARLGRHQLQLSLYDLQGRELASHKLAVAVTEQAALLALLIDELQAFRAAQAPRIRQLIGVALTLAGLVDPRSGLVAYSPGYPLQDLPLGPLLGQALGLPVYIGNDTRAHALAEHFFGASRDCQDSILISVHNGAGAGIISNGQVFLGKNSNVGEIGHIQVEPLGRRCHCGNFGCLETIAANPAILERVRELLALGHPSRLQADSLSIQAICEAANQGDGVARSVIEQVGEHLGRTIAIMVNLFNPEKILLAGEIMASAALLLPVIRRCVEHQSLPSFHRHLPIVPARFQSQGTMGGLALIKRALLEGDLLQRIMEKAAPAT